MFVSPALRAVCLRHDVNLDGCSPAELQEQLPAIVAAVEAERRSTLQHVAIVQKSALIACRFNELIPNEGITRAERLGDVSSPPHADDPNAVLDSIIPW